MNVATAQEGDEAWKWIWKIQAPPKTKHLLWRIFKGCLPTRTRLVERHVQCPTSCPICELEEESDWHILFECDNSKRAWQGAGLDHVILPIIQNATSVKEAILKMCQSSGRKEAGRAAMLLWVLWKNRNNWVWNHEKEHGQHLEYKAMQLWHEWEAVQLVYSSSTQQEQQPRLVTWQPPPQGKYKCNIDVGVHGEEKKTSMGWCVRDHRGQFVLGGTSWIYGNCTSNEGEALALLEAMKELQQRGFNDVIFETDAQNIVNATRHRTIGVSEFSSIIHKIKCMLSLNTGFEVKSIRRQANRVAHTLARATLSWSRSHVFDLIPLCIHNFLHNEMI
jgi:ribonuclease HI